MTFYCTKCGHVEEIDACEVGIRHRAGLELRCPECDSLMEKSTVPMRSNLDNKKRSQKQEKRVAAREGAKCQPASGSRSGYEDDVRKVGSFRGECKLTRAASYRLRLNDLMTLESHARGGELPVLDIEFQCTNPARRYVVLPEWVYETLMVESGRRKHADSDSPRA